MHTPEAVTRTLTVPAEIMGHRRDEADLPAGFNHAGVTRWAAFSFGQINKRPALFDLRSAISCPSLPNRGSTCFVQPKEALRCNANVDLIAASIEDVKTRSFDDARFTERAENCVGPIRRMWNMESFRRPPRSVPRVLRRSQWHVQFSRLQAGDVDTVLR
jgi:hypothetical protein